jgi:glycosyltransferase involved in cell wall biosynthesis
MPTSKMTSSSESGSLACSSRVRQVLIVKSALEQFRLSFYGGLEERLARARVQLRVAVPAERCRDCKASWLLPVEGGDLHLLGKTLSWQGVRGHARDAELIITQQGARELTNYLLLWSRRNYGYRLALWGHGTDFQRKITTPLAQFIKRRIFGGVDFWFAYTPAVARIVESQGFPRERICTVFNSVNTAAEIAFHDSVTEAAKVALRSELGMKPGAKLVSYCGSLYKAKRLDFLISACKSVRAAGMDLHLAVIGDGAERTLIERLGGTEQWIHFVGPAYGERKALILSSSECMTIPGVIGLVVVDAFAHECPLVTTCIPGHGPEIEYLVDGVNGIKCEIDQYSQAIVRVLTDPQLQNKLRQGCREAAATITMENMIERFASGILTAMQMPTRV